MEESKLTNEEDNSKESSPKTDKDIKNEQNVQAFSEFLEKASDQDVLQQKSNLNSQELKLLPIKDSVMKVLMVSQQILIKKC